MNDTCLYTYIIAAKERWYCIDIILDIVWILFFPYRVFRILITLIIIRCSSYEVLFKWKG